MSAHTEKKFCFQILEIICWKQNDFYKQGFLKKRLQ